MAKQPRREPITSIRLWPQLSAEIARRAACGAHRSELINQFAVEGMRSDSHPGVVFRDGPAGRRPGLYAGPDIWEVARVLREIEPRGERAIDATAESMGLTRAQVSVALGYYVDYRDEIDAWIDMVDSETETLERAWRQRSEVLA